MNIICWEQSSFNDCLKKIENAKKQGKPSVRCDMFPDTYLKMLNVTNVKVVNEISIQPHGRVFPVKKYDINL